MIPETWVPTSTSVTGSTVPVAVTELRMAIRTAGAVSSVSRSPAEGRSSNQRTAAVAATPDARSMLLFFMAVRIYG